MKTYIFIFFLFTFNFVYTQDLLEPFKSASFGSHKHANRDKSYFSTIDNQGNVIITATTENDSTFIDLLTTKLDPSLKVIWQVKTSIDTKLSFDVPSKTFVDSFNNLYTIVESVASNASEFNGLLSVLKYDVNGVLLWQFNFEDLKNPINHNYKYQKSFLDENNILHFVYGVENPSNLEIVFHFYSIDQNGKILEKISRNDIGDDLTKFTDLNFDFSYNENNFYLKYHRRNRVNNEMEYLLKKINNQSIEVFNFTKNIGLEDDFIYGQEEIKLDSNNNVYLFYSDTNKKKFKFIKINKQGQVSLEVSSKVGFECERVLEFFNKNGNYCILTNRKVVGESNLGSLNLIEYNDSGIEIGNSIINSVRAIHAKRFIDNTILVLTENGSFKLFDETLKIIGEFPGTNFQLNDYCKIDNTTIITAETSIDKMFPTSDYYSNLDVHINKRNLNGIVNTYSFSGQGTSMSYYSRLVIDSKNNYYLTRKEDFGETNYGPAGVHAPSKFYLDKYNTDFKLLWSTEIPRINTHLFETKLLVDANDNVFIYGDVTSTQHELIKVSNQGQIIFQIPSYPKKEIFFDNDKKLQLVTRPLHNNLTGESITTIYTIDSENGNLLVKKEFPSQQEFWGVFLSKSLDTYLYMYSKDYKNYSIHPKLFIYKNNVLQSVIDLDFSSSDGDPYKVSIDNNGTLFFTTDYTRRLHRIALDQKYSYITVNDRIEKIGVTPNNKVFTSDSKENIKIYNNDLSLFSVSDHDLGYFRLNSILNNGNNLLVNYIGGINDPNIFKVVDEKLNVLKFFKINEITPAGYYHFDYNSDLITIGGEGNNFRSYFDYRWSRAYIHKYQLETNSLHLDEFENDMDIVSFYPNPTNSMITILNPNNDEIELVKVYDISGRFLKSFYYSSIDLSSLDPSVYILKVFTKKGKVINKKVVKY